MSLLGKFIADDTPKMNRKIAEGFTYHEVKDAMEYIDTKIRYVEMMRTDTKLRYLGCRMLSPSEVTTFKFKGNTSRPFNVAESNNYYVEYSFQYSDEPEQRKMVFAIPYIERGNLYKINDKKWLIMPTITDKVISVGDSQVFIDILTAKYTLSRLTHTIIEDGHIRNVSVVTSEFYSNQAKRLPPTTNAKPTLMHYLLAHYGYTKTMEILLGFVPTPVLDHSEDDNVSVIQSRSVPPDNYFHARRQSKEDMVSGKTVVSNYKPNPIKFLVDKENEKPEVAYILGNVLYILDHFPGRIELYELDEPTIWRQLVGEIIHSGNHTVQYLQQNMAVHFSGFERPLDKEISDNLADLDIHVENMFELMAVIMSNFNSWIARNSTNTLYYNKNVEAKRYVLTRITFCFNRLYLDVNKEEYKYGDKDIPPEELNSLFRFHNKTNIINGINREKLFAQISEDSTDHLYFKGTSFINKQEGNSVNIRTGSGGGKNKLTACAGTVGSLTYLSKNNTDPCVKVNPWITLSDVDNTILPDPVFGDVVAKTAPRLLVTHTTSRIVDINDDIDPDVEDDEYYDDFDEYEDEFNDFED